MDKLIKYFKLLFYFFLIITFILALNDYVGKKYIYIFFSIVSIFHLLYSCRQNSFFVDKFVSIFIWLGFWFKMSCEIGYSIWGKANFREGSGLFDYKGESFDNVLIIASVAIISFILCSFFSTRFAPIYKHNKKNIKSNFYNNHKNKIFFCYLFLVIFIGFTNYYFGIYQKGLIVNEDFNLYISYIYRWLLLFGFTSIGCTLIYYEMGDAKLRNRYFYFIFFESFVSNISLLSRAVIFNFFSLILGLFYYSKKNLISQKVILYLTVFSLILFLVSFYAIEETRKKLYYDNSSLNYKNFEKIRVVSSDENFLPEYSQLHEGFFGEILYLATNRWVGVDALMAVSSFKSQDTTLGVHLIIESFDEKFSINEPSFYEKNFLFKKINEDKSLTKNNNIVILPGIVAYLYFSGSLLFVFFSIILIMSLCYLIEFFYYKLCHHNVLICSFMGYILASRIIHSGYLVSNNSIYILSLIINLIVIVILMKSFKILDKY